VAEPGALLRNVGASHAAHPRELGACAGSEKRGGGAAKVSLDEAVPVSEQPGQDLVALDDALQLLATVHPRKSSVVELRFFGGLSLEETAEALVSVDTVKRDFRFAKLWLLRELGEERPPDA
jgi:DNA-directed RNA polymerase specialized sigma24 family protein